MAKTVLSVPDVSCEHCERTITETLAPVQGVRGVRVDIPGKRVEVDYDDRVVSVDRFKELLQEEEYPVQAVLS